MSDYKDTDYFSEPETTASANLKSTKPSPMDILMQQEIIKTDDYHIIKVRKRTGGNVRIKPD
jgi:hypothetical protein